jgi:hypothetical protein
MATYLALRLFCILIIILSYIVIFPVFQAFLMTTDRLIYIIIIRMTDFPLMKCVQNKKIGFPFLKKGIRISFVLNELKRQISYRIFFL